MNDILDFFGKVADLPWYVWLLFFAWIGWVSFYREMQKHNEFKPNEKEHLANCPFCRSNDIVVLKEQGCDDVWYGHCCNTECEVDGRVGKTREQAVYFWNYGRV